MCITLLLLLLLLPLLLRVLLLLLRVQTYPWSTGSCRNRHDALRSRRSLLGSTPHLGSPSRPPMSGKMRWSTLRNLHGDTTVHGAGAALPHVELSLQFVSLEGGAAAACGIGDVALSLQKARMAFIEGHASKTVRQEGIFVYVTLGRGAAQPSTVVVHHKCSQYSTVVRYRSIGWSSALNV